jgi:hypothetical protein
MEEDRIYVAVAGTVQVPSAGPTKTVVQPAGRQAAQACHVVSKLRVGENTHFFPITTIILQARDSAELTHLQQLLTKRKLNPVIFWDTNDEYGQREVMTAIAVMASKHQVQGIMDYLPLWTGK